MVYLTLTHFLPSYINAQRHISRLEIIQVLETYINIKKNSKEYYIVFGLVVSLHSEMEMFCLNLLIFVQKELDWTGKRCKKINHSKTALSFLVPSFLNSAFSEEDSVSQISVDNSRHILYTLSEKGTISVFDLGENGMSTSRLACLSQNAILQSALSIARSVSS